MSLHNLSFEVMPKIIKWCQKNGVSEKEFNRLMALLSERTERSTVKKGPKPGIKKAPPVAKKAPPAPVKENEWKKMRKKANLSRKQLQEKSGISEAAIIKIETGRSMPRAETAHKWRQACGIDDPE